MLRKGLQNALLARLSHPLDDGRMSKNKVNKIFQVQPRYPLRPCRLLRLMFSPLWDFRGEKCPYPMTIYHEPHEAARTVGPEAVSEVQRRELYERRATYDRGIEVYHFLAKTFSE